MFVSLPWSPPTNYTNLETNCQVTESISEVPRVSWFACWMTRVFHMCVNERKTENHYSANFLIRTMMQLRNETCAITTHCDSKVREIDAKLLVGSKQFWKRKRRSDVESAPEAEIYTPDWMPTSIFIVKLVKRFLWRFMLQPNAAWLDGEITQP